MTDEEIGVTYLYVVIQVPAQRRNGHNGRHDDVSDGEDFPNDTTFDAESASVGEQMEIYVSY
jgi:hypothetical protein